MSDDELLAYDRSDLAHPPDERALLAEHGDVYRAQLVAARWIQDWADRLKEAPSGRRQEYSTGFDFALREIIAHLRQGDFLPGSQPYEQVMGGEVSR